VPLFVNEGPSADKLKTIRSSDYLSFCYDQLLGHGGCASSAMPWVSRTTTSCALRQAKPQRGDLDLSAQAFIQHQKRHYAKVFEGTG
jgi:hypothetical protein